MTHKKSNSSSNSSSSSSTSSRNKKTKKVPKSSSSNNIHKRGSKGEGSTKSSQNSNRLASSTRNVSNGRGSRISGGKIDRIYYIFAILSFIAGIVTPPLLNLFTKEPDSGGSVFSNSTSTTVTDERSSLDSTSSTNKSHDYFVECTQDQLAQFLHDEPIKGMHILCFPPFVSSSSSSSPPSPPSGQTMTFYEQASNHKIHTIPLQQASSTSYTFQDLKSVLSTKLNVEMYDYELSMKQPWAIYTTNGKLIVNEFHNDSNNDDDSDFDEKNKSHDKHIVHQSAMNILQKHGMVILFEGGSWLWPGVRIGFKRTISVADHNDNVNGKQKQQRNITLETLSIYPLVLSVENFIEDEECTHVQNKAKPYMQYSSVTLMDHDQDRKASDFRTSQSTFVNGYGDEIMERLEYRTASLTRTPRNHQEYTQVLRYGKGERYVAHLDWFDKNMYTQDQNTLELIDYGRRNRLVTVFWYLSDVEEGGHTAFPRFNKGAQPYNFDECNTGLMVKPQRGKVIVFYSLTADGKGDEYSLHGACAVKEGIKWAANKWVWNTPQEFVE